jgi:hypothetical protein
MSFRPYIKDMGLKSGAVIRPYGSSRHDSLRISPDGRTLSYENLQNGDGSKYGCYRFCDEEGRTPEEDPDLVKHGADAYFNIGGFVSDNDLELLKLYYGMSESMQRAIKEIMIVTQENRE